MRYVGIGGGIKCSYVLLVLYQLKDLIDRKEVTVTEAMKEYIKRIKSVEPKRACISIYR